MSNFDESLIEIKKREYEKPVIEMRSTDKKLVDYEKIRRD